MMMSEGERVPVEVAGVERLQGIRDTAVNEHAAWRKQLVEHHLADAVVRELEALGADLKDAVSNQLLHAFGGPRIAKSGRATQQREVEGAPDHRRHRHEPAAPFS